MKNDRFVEYYANESTQQSTLQRFAATKDAVTRAARHFGVAGTTWQVADIGCGAGTQCFMWAADGHSVNGLDINADLIELAKQRAHERQIAVSLSVGTATDLPWPTASMDICLCPELLEHVADWQTCLSQAMRVLRPGGILYVSTTNRLCPKQDEFKLPFYSWYPSRLKRHCERLAVTTHPEWVSHAKFPAINWFTYFELRDFLQARGFQCADRFDLIPLTGQGLVTRTMLGTIRAVPAFRWFAQTLTPYTALFARKDAVA